MTGESVRVDRWLWAIRATKTRSDATALCKGGKVEVNDVDAKPSTPVHVGDTVAARVHDRDRIFVVTRLIEKRVGAKIAVECYEDHSPPPPTREEFFFPQARRDRGAGRPTKRDRRDIDRLRGRDH